MVEHRYDMNKTSYGSALDRDNFDKAVGGELTKKSHINCLKDVEGLIKKHCPLRMVYDMNRPQKRYFSEFTFTEIFGTALYVVPMNTEVACKLAEEASVENTEKPELLREALLEKVKLEDKYNESCKKHSTYPKSIILPCGSNLIWQQVSKELIFRAMHEEEDIKIKPHPLTEKEDLRQLKINFGLDSILDKSLSGVDLVRNCDIIYSTSTSELGLYAQLLGKDVRTVGNFFEEHSGAYYPLYRLGRQSLEKLIKGLSNPMSGVFFKDTKEEEVIAYFDNAMKLREAEKPLSSKYWNEE